MHAVATESPAPPDTPSNDTRKTTMQASSPRFDSYRGIHKALRLFMCDTLTRIGRTDPGDDAEVRDSLDQVRALMDLCELHLHDENQFVHPALERASPGSSERIGGEHDEHREEIADLRDLAGLVADTQGATRDTALHRLYHALSHFVAGNFDHMLYEETAHNAVLWAHYRDDEILEIEHAIVASIPPAAMMAALRWFIPALSAPERAGMLLGMRAGMPAPAFAAVLDIARQTLSARDLAKLDAALAAVPAQPAEIS